MRLRALARRRSRGKGMLTKNLTASLIFRARHPPPPRKTVNGIASQSHVAVQQKLIYKRANENRRREDAAGETGHDQPPV
jgi:hypothetical protein